MYVIHYVLYHLSFCPYKWPMVVCLFRPWTSVPLAAYTLYTYTNTSMAPSRLYFPIRWTPSTRFLGTAWYCLHSNRTMYLGHNTCIESLYGKVSVTWRENSGNTNIWCSEMSNCVIERRSVPVVATFCTFQEFYIPSLYLPLFSQQVTELLLYFMYEWNICLSAQCSVHWHGKYK